MQLSIFTPPDAPGALDSPEGIATPHHEAPDRCPGCREHSSPWCAACGALAAVFLPSGPNDEHSMPLCSCCYALVRAIRGEAESARQLTAARVARKRQGSTTRKGAA